tara:strand:+ start:10914 stop:11069 length:156 start_codon:yes stop_codon:yes gene_type:complete
MVQLQVVLFVTSSELSEGVTAQNCSQQEQTDLNLPDVDWNYQILHIQAGSE